MYKIYQKNKMILIIIFIFIFLGSFYFIYGNNEEEEISKFETKENIIENKKETEEEKTIVVHVAGAVKNPGIVTLKENSRISEAIEKAGGLLENANIDKINLAYVLKDGIKIYIPCNDNDEEVEIMEENSGIQEVDYKEENIQNIKVNINNANISELSQLPGIGDATALKIINYREENGKFNNIEEIQDVKGIGDAKYESIKDLICAN